MTTSTSLYAAGISSRNASLCRHSMPRIDSSSWARVKVLRAFVRENARPAPCGDDSSDAGCPRPLDDIARRPHRAGDQPVLPLFAWIAPFLETHSCSP